MADGEEKAVLSEKRYDRHTKLALRESLRTHKVFVKDQCFYLNYHNISIKSYVADVY